MTDPVSFPPLLDLSPAEINVEKERLLNQMRRPERAPLALTIPQLPRLRVAVNRHVAAIVCVTVVAGAIVGAVTLSGRSSPSAAGPTHTVTNRQPKGLGALSFYNFAGSNPFGAEGTSVTLTQLAEDAPAVPLPNSPLANSGNAGSVWETSGGSAAVYYPSSAIELMVVNRTGPLDNTSYPSKDVQTIDGYSAHVAPGIPEAKPPVPAQLIIAIPGGKALELTGPDLADLIDVAKTLPLP